MTSLSVAPTHKQSNRTFVCWHTQVTFRHTTSGQVLSVWVDTEKKEDAPILAAAQVKALRHYGPAPLLDVEIVPFSSYAQFNDTWAKEIR